MIDPAQSDDSQQSNDPIKVPTQEPVKLEASSEAVSQAGLGGASGSSGSSGSSSNMPDKVAGMTQMGDDLPVADTGSGVVSSGANDISAATATPTPPASSAETPVIAPAETGGDQGVVTLVDSKGAEDSNTLVDGAVKPPAGNESASVDEIAKIAESLEEDVENIAANSTDDSLDETAATETPAESSSEAPSATPAETPAESAPATESTSEPSSESASEPTTEEQTSDDSTTEEPTTAEPSGQVNQESPHISSPGSKPAKAETPAVSPEAAAPAATSSPAETPAVAPADPPPAKINSNGEMDEDMEMVGGEETAPKKPASESVSDDEEELPEGVDPNKAYNNVVEVLKDQKAISKDEANQIMVQNISSGKSFEAILEENKFVKEEDLVRAKSIVHSIPFIKISESGTDPQALTKIPEGVARNYQMLPISFDKERNSLVVAMKNPLDLSAIDFAEQKSGVKIIAKYAMASELERKIAENYSQSLSSEVTAALEQTSQVIEDQSKKQDLKSLSGETIRQAPITKIVQTIVSFAMKARASDVHIEPQETRTRVRYRIDGILVEKLILPKSVHEAVVSRVKILSGLKIDEKRIPQDGRFNFVSGDKEVDLRVSTLPTVNGEKIVMRLLKKDATVPALEELGLTGMALRKVQDAIKVPHGIILVTGPTGSGKTTTLYSVLHTINTPKVNIMTLEDPVEYQMTSVNQVQVNQKAGLTFASGLRSFLRQDPNIIMVGEIRDSETADLAVQASLTGHLVFSTLHTSSAAGAIPRLLDMGVEPFLLASSLTLAMAQRVVRRVNPEYKEEYKPEPAVVEDMKKVLGPRWEEWLRKNNKKEEEVVLYKAKSDRPQTEPEYKGRIAIFEVMPVSEPISKLILERKPASEMEKVALNNGMLLMKQDGYIKALDGITTIEEVLRVAQI